MAQKSWTYADPLGRLYKIGLYHGDNTGHVIVYCNDSIMVIDFAILETKKYSFYIGDEFFELDLNKHEQDDFQYNLQINSEVNTPLNNIRNQKQDHYTLLSLGLGILILCTIFFTSYLLT